MAAHEMLQPCLLPMPLPCSLCCAMPLRIGAVRLMASPFPLVSMDCGALPRLLVPLRRLSSQVVAVPLLSFASLRLSVALLHDSMPPLRSLFIAFARRRDSMPFLAIAMLGLPSPCHCVASLRHAFAQLCHSAPLPAYAAPKLRSLCSAVAFPSTSSLFHAFAKQCHSCAFRACPCCA